MAAQPQPKYMNLHMAGQVRRAHALRQEAIGISENIHSMVGQVIERAERCGWKDHFVEEGLRIIHELETEYHGRLSEAKRFDSLIVELGA